MIQHIYKRTSLTDGSCELWPRLWSSRTAAFRASSSKSVRGTLIWADETGVTAWPHSSSVSSLATEITWWNGWDWTLRQNFNYSTGTSPTVLSIPWSIHYQYTNLPVCLPSEHNTAFLPCSGEFYSEQHQDITVCLVKLIMKICIAFN